MAGGCGPPASPHFDAAAFGASERVSHASIFAKFFSPMPLTFITSLVERKAPDFWRYSTIRPARAGPTPGSVASCSAFAVLRLTFDVGSALDAAPATARAGTTSTASATARTAATKRRYMGILLG